MFNLQEKSKSLKRDHLGKHFKIRHFFPFFYFEGHFCPSDPDAADQKQCGSMWIRIRAHGHNNDEGVIIMINPMREPGRNLKRSMYGAQCPGSICFWASWIRIRILNFFVRIVILPQQAKNEENPWVLLFCDFFKTFYLRRMMKMYLQRGMRIKTYLDWKKKNSRLTLPRVSAVTIIA